MDLLKDLEASHNIPKSVKKEDEFTKATTMMRMNDFSQLPVVANDNSVIGYISWETISRRYILNRKNPTNVRDCMDEGCPTLDEKTPLIDAVSEIVKKEFIVVTKEKNIPTGIVTSTDIAEKFNELAKPFFLLAKIEGTLKRIIAKNADNTGLQKLRSTSNNRQISDVKDLDLGQCISYIASKDNWRNIFPDDIGIQRKAFIDKLEEIKDIRNDFMHFRKTSLEPNKLKILRKTLRILEELYKKVSTEN